MKKLILLALISTAPLTATASESEGFCNIVYDLSKFVMTMRQDGKSMSDMMKIASGDSAGELSALMKSITIDAYSEPRFSTEKHKQNAVDDFANKVVLSCYKTAENTK